MLSVSADPDGCRLTIAHTGPWTGEEPAEAYRTGWTDTIDALEGQLQTP